MEKLFQHNIPVIVGYGNHDHLNGTWTRFALPSNVYELPAETSVVQLKIRGQQVNIYGFSYPERHLKASVIESYPTAHDQHAIHIGMLHGSEAGNTTHDVYALLQSNSYLKRTIIIGRLAIFINDSFYIKTLQLFIQAIFKVDIVKNKE